MELINALRLTQGLFNATEYGASPSNTEAQNTTAFSAALTAIIANGGGILFIPRGLYLGKISIPAISGTNWLSITVMGESQPVTVFGTIGTFTLPNNGTIIKSNNTAYGAVVKAEQNTAPGNYMGFSSVHVSLLNLEIRTANNPAIHGVDLNYAQQMSAENLFINNSLYSPESSDPTNAKVGLITPAVNNGALTRLQNIVISGYHSGIFVNEHTNGDNINIVCCRHGLNFQANGHASSFFRYGAYRNTNNITVSGAHRFGIFQMNIEHANVDTQTDSNNIWQVTAYDINDPSNLGKCKKINYAVVKGDVGPDTTFTKNGGTGITCEEIA